MPSIELTVAELFTKIDDRRYHSRQFCQRWFRYCDDLRQTDPPAAISAARVGWQLAQKARDSALIAGAAKVLGSALRSCGRLDASEEMYREAFEHIKALDERGQADLHHRYASLLRDRRQLRETPRS